jgi:hypothetical protein
MEEVMRSLHPVILSLFAIAAVARPAVAQSQRTIDSAGVRVVLNPDPGANPPGFRLSVRPRVAIGQVEGSPEYQLFRADQAFVLSDGTLVVANTGTQELRFYDRSGKYLRTAGKKGQGPGEFASLELVGPFAGDSLLISDTQLKRYSIFDRAGRFARSFPAPTELGPVFHLTPGILGSRRLVAFASVVGPFYREPSPRLRRPVTIHFLASEGRVDGTLGEFPGTEIMTGGAARAMTTGPVIFGRRLHATARGNRIAVANDDQYSVRVYDEAGKLLQVVRQSRKPVAPRPGDFEKALPPGLQGGATPNSPLARNLKAMLDDRYEYATLPAFGGPGGETSSLRLDPAGILWVQEYQIDRDEPGAWQAFDRDGVFVGRLELPDRSTLLDVGADWVLLRTLDELDVEHVQLYGLERPSGAR